LLKKASRGTLLYLNKLISDGGGGLGGDVRGRWGEGYFWGTGKILC